MFNLEQEGEIALMDGARITPKAEALAKAIALRKKLRGEES